MAISKSNKQILLGEKSYDTGVYAVIPMVNVIDINPAVAGEDIDVVCSSMGTKRSYQDNYHTTVNFAVETNLTGVVDIFDNGGTLETYSNLDCLFIMSGMKSDVSTLDKIIYTMDSDNAFVSSLKFYKEDLLREITGGIASLTLSGTVGEPLKINYDINAYTDLVPTSESAPEGLACSMTDLAIINKITGVTVGGVSVNMQSFSLNSQVEVQDTYATGISQYDMTDFDPQLELTTLKILNSTLDWTSYQNESLTEIVITATTKSGTVINLTIPQAKLNVLEDGDDSGRGITNKTFRCESNLGDDNFTLTITAP